MRTRLPASLFLKLSYCYLALPFIIFALGWMKLYLAIPLSLLILYILYRMFLATKTQERIALTKDEIKKIVVIVGIILFWVLLSGIGKQAYQSDDHLWRNALFETLVNEDWPIIQQVNVNGMEISRGISYYIGFWLPSALVGKLFGLTAGFLFQIIWATLGISLFYYGICIILKKISILPLFIFMFFSGLDIVGIYVTGYDMSTISQEMHIEWWTNFQFSSNTTQLFWVFNQAIPIWLITITLYLQKDNRSMIFILANAMLSCTMPFLGLLPFVLYWLFSKTYDTKRFHKAWWKAWIKDTITIENIIGGIIAIISMLYLLKYNESESMPLLFDLRNGGWLVISIFLLVEIAAFCILIYKHQKNNPLYYILIVWLCLCPLLQIYGGKNFCMRASIPSLLLLFLYFTKSCYIYIAEKDKRKLCFAIGIFLIGAITPLHEMVRSVSETQKRYLANESVNALSVGTEKVLLNDYESTDVQNNMFFKYLAK